MNQSKSTTVKLLNRRDILKLCGAISITGAAVLTAQKARAGGHNKVPTDDPQAVTLGYVEDASTVDKTKFDKYEAGRDCSNCLLYKGADDAAYGPCPIFQGREVSAKGWCNAYTPKA